MTSDFETSRPVPDASGRSVWAATGRGASGTHYVTLNVEVRPGLTATYRFSSSEIFALADCLAEMASEAMVRNVGP